jgi:D-lyxose ketol-isomerase
MKRSEINRLQKDAVDFFRKQNFYLPKWAFWTKNDWQKKQLVVTEIVENKLGWDITDFGLNDFEKSGLLLFTIRNGKFDSSEDKTYAEKIMIVQEEQITPWHFHWNKTEDIINRGGGNLIIELCKATEDEKLSDAPVNVQIDGIRHTINPKGKIVLEPGESISLQPYLYHTFYGQKGKGTVLVGEVSSVNEDDKDNRFLENYGRFPEIVEDEAPLYYLCNEYPVN